MKGMSGRIIGDAEHFTFEERIFNFVILLGICMTAFGTIMDLYYRADILIDLSFVGCWILTYYLSRVRGYFNVVSVVSMGVFVFAFFPYNWIVSNGSNGSMPYYAIIFIAFVSIVLSGRFRIVMVVSMLAVELLLICRDAYYSGSLAVGNDKYVSLLDLPIHMLVIMLTMAVLIIVYSNTYMKEKARSEAYARTIEEYYRQQLYYMENLESLIYKLKSERHDFNNHLGVIYGLLEGGETKQARGYVKQQVKTAEEYRNLVNIPYSMVRAMLNYKLSAARDSKIELRLDISVPEALELNEFDLTVILGNLLDNAIEACAALGENSRYIGLSLLYKPDYLVIQVENPSTGEALIQEGKVRSSKSDPASHGFGLRTVEYLAEKHDGFVKIEPGIDVFKVSVAVLVEPMQ